MAALIAHVLAKEAPILDTLLVQRIARAHGFKRSGRLITDRILELVESNHSLRPDPAGGIFVWENADSLEAWCRYRSPLSENDLRKIEEIASEEIRAASLACSQEDPTLEIARIFGTRRLNEQARERIQAATEHA